MKLPDDILRRRPEEAARRIALGFLGQAREALFRLDDAADDEALHDFRVAIRRLRSTIRAWRPHLEDAVSRKDRRALRALQESTGAGRDAEVLLAWLAPHRDDLAPEHRRGVDWLAVELEARRDAAYARVREEVRKRFGRVHDRLVERLAVMTVEVHLLRNERPPTYGEALALRVHDRAAELAELLGAVETADDREPAHRARIACERLRYLVEPVRPFSPQARGLVKQCKALQDLLGDLNDAALLVEELDRAIGHVASGDARPGLVELRRRAEERIGSLFERLSGEWLGDCIEPFERRIDALAGELSHEARRDVEIERKYLLAGLPDEVHRHPVVEIEQGYVPGKRLQERIRRVRHAGGVDHKRTVKLGSGIARTEIDEPTTPAIFEAMWPLTEGRRVLKRRYEVPANGLTWEIDEFTDRELYLAEVELPSEDHDPEIPGWLRPFIVREVTDDPAYLNIELAK